MKFIVDTQVGPYQVFSLLGVGGIGEVFVARHTQLERSRFLD